MDDMKDASQNEEFKSVIGQMNSIPANNKNRMNLPFKNESRLTFYRSQVIEKGDKIPLLSKNTRITNLRQSLVPVMQQNCEESGENQMRIEINHQNKNNNLKNNGHLHSSRAKNTINSPLLTCRSAENLGPKTLRENPYFPENDRKLEENRSVKFIAKIRQQISSNQNINKCSRVTKKPERAQGTVENKNEKNMNLFLALTERNKELQRELQDSNITENMGIKFQDPNLSQNLDQSLQRQTFEQKLRIKCKDLQYELEVKQEQILKLSNALKNLQLKYISELEALKNQYSFENSRKDFEIQQLKYQLSNLESNKKAVDRQKISKQKIYQQQISRYLKQLAQSEQSKNKMILQFEDILKQRLQTNQKSYSNRFTTQLQRALQENTILKRQLQDLVKKINQMQKEKQNMIQESNLLNRELGNYIKWNDELAEKNLSMEREGNQKQRINKELQQECKNMQQKMNTFDEIKKRCEQYSSVFSKLSHQMQILKFENHSLKNQMEIKQKSYQKSKLTYLRNVQKLRTQMQAKLRSLNTALSQCKLENCNLKSIFTAKQKQLQSQTNKIEAIQKQHLNTLISIETKHNAEIDTMTQLNISLLNKKQDQMQRQKQLITILKAKIQHLQIEIEEWKFISESNALNNSLIKESKQNN